MLLCSTSAFAQTGYEPLGVRLGAFMLTPSITVSGVYDDNVFSVEGETEEDQAILISPEARLVSNWSIHEIALEAGSTTRTGSDFGGLNYTDWRAGASGRFDATVDTSFTGAVRYAHINEPLSEAPDVGLREPAEYDELDASLGASVALSRTRFSVGAGYNKQEFEDALAFDDTVVPQGDRDRTLYTAQARVDYELSPATGIFASAGYNRREHEFNTPDFNRDSDGYDALVGLTFELTRLIEGEVGVGYFSQSYEDASLDESSGLRVNSRFDWRPDELVVVSVEGRREVSDAGARNAIGVVNTSLNVTTRYEFRRNVSFSVGAGYVQEDYEGIDREDERLVGSASADYLLNRIASVFVGYRYETQESTGAAIGREYDKNVFSVGFRLRR